MRTLLLIMTFAMTAGFASAQAKTCSKAEKAACAKTCTAAQKAACAKTCTATQKAACAKTAAAAVNVSDTQVLSAIAAADLAAENDENIERKECSMSGKVSYFHKSTCAASGKVSMNEVKYCSDSQAFVNASPSAVMSDKAAKVIKTADTVDGKVQKTSATKKKACCKGKKACSKTKAGA